MRAISILAVLSFHGVTWLRHIFGRGGWLGVDIFFVISGFLITRLALAEIAGSGKFEIGKFFMRRLFRINPALWVMLAYCAIVNPFGTDESINRQAIAMAALNLTDYNLALNWAKSSFSPVNVCWSLAVEEKFYLLFPFLMLAYKRFRTPMVFVSLLILAEAWKAYLVCSGVHWMRLTAAFDTRFDEILIGCLSAGILSSQGERWRKGFNLLAHPIATATILFATWYLLRHFMHPGELQNLFQRQVFWLFFVPLFASLVGLLLISLTCAQANGRVSLLAKALSIPPMLLVGRLSYSLYLWHSVAFFAVSQSFIGDLGLAADSAKVGLSLVLAGLSYLFVEKPFLEIKKRLTIRSLKIKTASDSASSDFASSDSTVANSQSSASSRQGSLVASSGQKKG